MSYLITGTTFKAQFAILWFRSKVLSNQDKFYLFVHIMINWSCLRYQNISRVFFLKSLTAVIFSLWNEPKKRSYRHLFDKDWAIWNFYDKETFKFESLSKLQYLFWLFQAQNFCFCMTIMYLKKQLDYLPTWITLTNIWQLFLCTHPFLVCTNQLRVWIFSVME